MEFSFIHISDIHLGRPFSGLSVYSNDENIIKIVQNATENALKKAIDFAIEKQTDFVLISGDVFDSTQQDFNSKWILKNQLKRLESEKIKTYIIAGNHDPIFSYNKNTFDFDEHSIIKIVGLNTPINSKFTVNDKNNLPCALIQAISYKENSFKENILNYLSAPNSEEKSLFNIALLHCDLNGTSDSDYAPCNSGDLFALNFDYYALGHIHIPNEYYVGTLQGRNTKETGIHGFKYITVKNNKIKNNEFIQADVVRYEDLTIDLSSACDTTSAYDLISETVKNYTIEQQNRNCELYLFRLNLIGFINFYNELTDEFFEKISEKIKEEFCNKICISKIKNNTSLKADINKLKEDTGIIGELYSQLMSEEELELAFNCVNDDFKKILPACNFTKEELQEFKSEICTLTKDFGINLCNNVYGNEDEEV